MMVNGVRLRKRVDDEERQRGSRRDRISRRVDF
jgi:hypothetical protein